MGVRVTSDTDKYCYTDANGDYALADLQTGSRTLEAALTGYTFTAGFTNPLTLTTSGATAQDWTATSVPELTITATNAAEGGAAGSFVISRTGDASAALREVLVPAEYHSVVEMCLGVGLVLWEGLFLTRGKTVETSPAPLRDRMEVRQLAGDTVAEKEAGGQRPIRTPAALGNYVDGVTRAPQGASSTMNRRELRSSLPRSG